MLSTRFMNLLVYAALSVLSIVIIRAVSGIPVTMPGDVGTHFFPMMLSYGVLGFCVIGAIRAVLGGPGEIFRVDNMSRLVVTVTAMALFFLSWSTFGAFYPQAFVFLFLLFTYFRLPLGVTARSLAINFALAFGITAFCYLVFQYLIFVDL